MFLFLEYIITVYMVLWIYRFVIRSQPVQSFQWGTDSVISVRFNRYKHLPNVYTLHYQEEEKQSVFYPHISKFGDCQKIKTLSTVKYRDRHLPSHKRCEEKENSVLQEQLSPNLYAKGGSSKKCNLISFCGFVMGY